MTESQGDFALGLLALVFLAFGAFGFFRGAEFAEKNFQSYQRLWFPIRKIIWLASLGSADNLDYWRFRSRSLGVFATLMGVIISVVVVIGAISRK